MSETSTTAVDNSGEASTEPITATDTKTADASDNLDTSSSADTTVAADDDQKSTDTTTTTATDDAPASSFDEDLDDWAVKRGFPKPESDEQRTAYQETRNEQREFTKTRQAEKAAADAKALGDEVHSATPEGEEDEDDDELDPVEKRVKDLEADRNAERATRMQSEYILTNKVTTEEVTAMGKVLKEMVDKEDTPEEKKAAHAYWTNPKRLEQWHKLAKASMSDSETDTQVAVDEATQAERARIAKESKATSPGRGASATTSGAKTPEQQRLERFSTWD